ncbi:sodium:proton antiporter [Salinarimonas ramus]|uniref:Cation:proton antiporter n=1 Tax=Salinarimonas ramus TaxID=690164 RepID=A0A917QAC5_9HYPH|nr:NADH-quinone oxidoreductase subunit K [Salinarimonas ramus]GGK36106.1 cation:proton antiporter [Salinarimonas ramus]
MTLIYALAIAAYVGCGLYMMLSRHAVRMILGLTLLTNGAIFLIFLSGRVGTTTPPVIPQGAEALAADAANALPQALVLTAIVIGFALTSFAVALVLEAHRSLGTLDVREMRDAERLGAPDPSPATSVKTHG